MSAFNRLPLHWRLTLLITSVCAVALAVAFAGYFFLELWRLRSDIAERVAPIQAVLNERAVTALAVDPDATEFGLNVLDLSPTIVAAAIYGADGSLRAKYVKPDSNEFIPRPRDYAFDLTADEAVIFRPLMRDQRRLGTLYLKAEVGNLVRARLLEPLRGMVMLFLGTLLLALGVSRLLQRTISRPITALASAARHVAEDRDYSIRTPASGGSETTVLVEAFNSMLTAIQQRDAELTVAQASAENARAGLAEINHRLEEANQTLEMKVRLRTAELENALVLAHEASSAKSAFLARMSHELRTPLTAIIGYSEILLEDADERADQNATRDLQRILDSARHLLALIRDVLDFSKIEAGRTDLHLETFDLAALVQEVAASLNPLIERSRNQLTLACGKSPLEIHADLAKVRQILINLLGNSAKFTENGIIELRVSLNAPSAQGAVVVVEVSDTGMGMDSEQLARIFTPFVQADPAISARYGGSGLGLALSRQFARLMGGDVTAISQPGQGSTFTVVWPARVLPPAGNRP